MEIFFAVVKSFDANTAISANLVLTVKNSNLEIVNWASIMQGYTRKYV